MQRLKTSLELEDDIKLHETGWIIQRVGWIIILLLVIAASLGIFGNGLLSKAEIIDDGNKLSFEKRARYEAPMQMTIHATSRNERIDVRIPQSYFNIIELDKVVPEPLEQTLANGFVIFTFETEGPSTVKFYLIPEKTGTITVQIKVNESDFSISHFIYP